MMVVLADLFSGVVDVVTGALFIVVVSTAAEFGDVTAMMGSAGALGVAFAVDVDAAVIVISEVVTDGWTGAAFWCPFTGLAVDPPVPPPVLPVMALFFSAVGGVTFGSVFEVEAGAGVSAGIVIFKSCG